MQLQELKAQFEKELSEVQKTLASDQLQTLKTRYIGKKGEISQLMRGMASLSPEEKRDFGKQVNELRSFAENALAELGKKIESVEIDQTLRSSRLDPTLPGAGMPLGALHPMNQLREDILDFFTSLGFEVATGREVEHDWYNFEALNVPPDHPARDMQDTFYVSDQVVLRTQTSNIQIHVMENRRPPLKIIAPGHVYRRDSDASHAPMFQQVEGLVVDRDISFADLKGTLYLWAEHMFGKGTRIRFRPSFFPFTEPSAEMDVGCVFCKGTGCRVCKMSGWLEIGGCGCVDPNVFDCVGIDPEKFTGFAFGFGIDRIAMLLYSIPEIGLLTRNDLRFLKQFR